jgi:N-methylhydantoinase B
MGALAEALPERVMAPGFDGLWDTRIDGVGRSTGRHFSFTWFSAGGTGALRGQDGLSATAYPSGVAGVAVEVIETLAPIVLRRRELRPDSGGAGTFRGGLGQTMDVEVLTDEPYVFSGLYERIRCPAPGLHGGEPGAPGRVSTNNGVPLPSKVSQVVPPDTVVTLELPGGGGYGPPSARDPERVLEDVREGYVSPEQAREAYGVAIDPVSLAVLPEETARLRSAMAARSDRPGAD